MKQIARILIDVLLACAVILLVPFAWLMRDGLGPDATTSTGIYAIVRCLMTFYTGPILIGLIALSMMCHRAVKKKQDESAK